MIKFGSRLELFVPLADKHTVSVKPGEKVVAGESVLARYYREGDA